MNKTNILKASGLTLAVVAGSTLAVTAASAHMGANNSERQLEKVSEIAERFDLEESEVQAYFDEKKQEQQEKREANRAEHVSALVEAGTLTQEQADALTALKDSFRSEVQALKESGADREEIKTAMEDHKDEVESWAEAEGVSLDDIRPEKGEKRGHQGPRGPQNGERNNKEES